MARWRSLLAFFAALFVAPTVHAYYDDVHYALTYYLARCSGYTQLQAYRIASLAVQVDYDSDTEPVQFKWQLALTLTPLESRAQEPRWRFHAMRDERRFRDSVGNGDQASEAENDLQLIQEENWKNAVEVLRNPGAFLHSMQDVAPHRGYGTKWGHWPLEISEFPKYLGTKQVVGGTTDWISYRQTDVEAVCAKTASYLRAFMKAECPGQAPRPYDQVVVERLVAKLADANRFPAPLTTDAQRRLYVAYKQSKFGVGTTNQADSDLQNLAGQLGVALKKEDAAKHDVGPDMKKVFPIIDSALEKAGFREGIPENWIKYQLDGKADCDWAQINDWALSGHLKVKFKSDRQLLVQFRMAADGPNAEYDLGAPISVEANETKVFEDLPVGPLVMLVQAGPVSQRYEFTLTGRLNQIPDVEISSASGKVSADPDVWTCAGPVLSGFTAIRDLKENEFLPVFGASPGTVTFTDADASKSGTCSWSGPPSSIRAGESVTLTCSARNMHISFTGTFVTDSGRGSISTGALDPLNPPRSTNSRTFVFSPKPNATKVAMVWTARPTQSTTWGSCGVNARYIFTKGAPVAGLGGGPPVTKKLTPEVLEISRKEFEGMSHRHRPTVEELGPVGNTSLLSRATPPITNENEGDTGAFSAWPASSVGTVDMVGSSVDVALPSTAEGEAASFSPKSLDGNFDLTVDVTLADWEPVPNGLLRWSLYLSRKSNGDQKVLTLSHAASPGNESLMAIPAEGQPNSQSVTGRRKLSVRFSKKGDQVTVQYQRGTEWVTLSEFVAFGEESLYLGVSVSKRGATGKAKVSFEPHITK